MDQSVDEGTYKGTVKDIRIRTDDYNQFKESNGITCSPQLKNGRTHSFQDVECGNQYISMSALMRLLIGQSITMTLAFGEEDGKTFVEVYDSSGSTKLYKVSNSTSDPGSVNIALIIIIVVVVVVIIVVIVVILLVLASKKKQKTKKLPTQTVSAKPVQVVSAPVAPTQPAPAQPALVEAKPTQPVVVEVTPVQATPIQSTSNAPAQPA